MPLFGHAIAANVTLAWDPVSSSQLGGYELQYRLASGSYDTQIDVGNKLSARVTSLQAGETYRFRVRAYSKDKSTRSGFSNQVSKKVPSPAPNPAPTAAFSANKTSGTAPLTVLFTDASTGTVGAREWRFGDGNKATDATQVTHTYSAPGTYNVRLSVSGPGGSDVEWKGGYIVAQAPPNGGGGGTDGTDLTADRIEAGEIELNHKWQRVEFQQTFVDPVVVVKPLSANGSDPAVIRVEEVDQDGFWVRLQEWDYLDGAHGRETASYLVVEHGQHQLPDGSWVEAGLLDTSATSFINVDLFAPFTKPPVVLAGVATYDEEDAVTTRLRRIDQQGFQIKLQEQEANARQHANETIAFVAWEPSRGTIDGQRFEVGRTANAVRHNAHTINFATAFDAPPAFLADMQSTDGNATANLRWDNKNIHAVDVWVDEEQSSDSDVRHTTEKVGYIALASDTESNSPTSYSVWRDSDRPANPSKNDPRAAQLGVKFTSDVNGYITGIRFYKGTGNTGTHVGNLWTSGGKLLARATFTNETATGWQQVDFDSPVAINANTVYVASYHAPNGHYAIDPYYFSNEEVRKRALSLLRDGISGSNGVYAYGSRSVFPTSSWRSSNYWVDVVFSTGP